MNHYEIENCVAGAKANITLPGIKDFITESEVATVMNSIIDENIFTTSGGDLVSKYSAQ